MTIPAGETWTLSPGINWTFTGSYKFRAEGTLNINGSPSSPDTIRGSGWPGSWFGIEFYNSYFTSSISHTTIKDASYALNLINSSVAPNPLVLRDNNYAVNCSNYSDPSFISTVFQADNWGVHADATSVPYLGNYTGYNSFRTNGYYDIYSTYPGTIWARGNWWGACPPFPSVTANVDYSDWLCVDPNPSIMSSGEGPDLIALKGSVNYQSGGPVTSSIVHGPDMQELNSAYRLFLERRYQDALQAFESVVGTYPDNFSAGRALVFAERCLEQLGRSLEIPDRLNIVSTTHSGKLVARLARARLVYQYIRQGMYQEAVNQASKTVSSDEDTSLVKFALYDLGSIYWYRMGDSETGERYFRELITRFPNDPLSHSALATLVEFTPTTESVGSTAKSETLSAKLSVQNYPNPFNPSTVIQFTVPQDGQVSLKVYDVLGREVATLIDEYMKQGFHQAFFDASDIPSGVYFYRLTSGEQAMVQKMMLVR